MDDSTVWFQRVDLPTGEVLMVGARCYNDRGGPALTGEVKPFVTGVQSLSTTPIDPELLTYDPRMFLTAAQTAAFEAWMAHKADR